jgi:hypothetical protein
MKRLFLFSILMVFFSHFKGQTWVDLGFKGGIGANFLMNRNIWSDDDYNHALTAGYCFGGKIGFNFNQEHEITFDAIFGRFNQDFNYSISDTLNDTQESYTSSIGFNKVDLALMYRHNKNGSYLELGPCISFINSPFREDTRANAPQLNTNDINTMNKGVILGFGNYLAGTDNFGITGGIRITHYLDDLISPNGITRNQPTLKKYEDYGGSRPLFIELIFEANFDFAYVAKASCGRKKLMFF